MSGPDWQRLGELLQRRRVEIDPRYRNLALFAREHGLNERLVSDIEHGRRGGYRKGTRMALEIAYELDPGSIARFLAGAAAALSPVPPAVPAGIPDDDPAVAYARSLPGLTVAERAGLEHVARTPGLDAAMRLTWVRVARAMQEGQQGHAQGRSA